MFILIILAIVLASVYICVVVAKKRNLRPVFWGLMSAFILGPLGIPFVLFSKPSSQTLEA